MKTPLNSNWYKRFILPLMAAAIWLPGGPQALATTYYWDANTTNSTVDSGGGTWDTTSTVWTTSTSTVSNVPWVYGSGNVASFGGASGTSGAYQINVATTGSLQTITFVSSGYALKAATSSTISLGIGGLGGITLSNNASAIIGDGITLTAGTNGSLPFTVQGTGTLTVASSSASAPATLRSMQNNNFNIIGGATVVVGTNGVLLCTAYSTGTGTMVVGNNTSNATLTVDGGLVTTFNNLVIGNNAATGISTVNITSGTVASTTGTGIIRFGTGSASTSGTGILNLNGGVLSIGGIGMGTAGLASYYVNFNGGTLQATQSTTSFMNSYSQISAKVQAGGAVFDTNGYNISVNQALVSGTASDGGLVKKGAGTLTLNGANTYNGKTVVQNGTLAVGASGAISNTLVLGESGATTGTLDVTAKGSGANFTLSNISGNGTIVTNAGTVTANGTVAPGFSAGLLTITGNLTLGSDSSTEMQLAGSNGVAGTDFDKIVVSGLLVYGGDLTISSYGGFDLATVGTYDLFDSQSYSGNFASVTINGISLTESVSGTWTDASSQYSFSESSGELSILAVVPEPSTYAMLLGGLGMLGFLRRKLIA